jgi:hypothetical protein
MISLSSAAGRRHGRGVGAKKAGAERVLLTERLDTLAVF